MNNKWNEILGISNDDWTNTPASVQKKLIRDYQNQRKEVSRSQNVAAANENFEKQILENVKKHNRDFLQSGEGQILNIIIQKLFPNDYYDDDTIYDWRAIINDSGTNGYFNYWNEAYLHQQYINEILEIYPKEVWDIINEHMSNANSQSPFINYFALCDNWKFYNLAGQLMNKIITYLKKQKK